MTTAGEIISRRVVVGRVDERLADVSARIGDSGAHHCAVLDGAKFVGLVRLGEAASYSHGGNRILGDLVSSIQPLVVRSSEPADSVTKLFSQHQLFDAVILDDVGNYVGLATAESVLEWTLGELKQREEALRQTQARLEAASQAKDIFLRSLSHELRTPLNPILLIASEGAANAGLPEEVRQEFGVVATQALLEAQLIDGLLDLTRASKGTIRLDLRATDVHGLLSHLGEEFRARLDADGPRLEINLSADRSEVMADAAKLEQAFRQLLKSALDANPRPTNIRISSHHEPDEKTVTIIFSDNGVGMTPLELEHAFEPFPRDNHPRLGLGRTLARAIILLHAGTIAAKSEGPGRGVSFEIRLPLSSSDSVVAPT